MSAIIQKTIGGISPQYYFRQFIFGLIFPLLFYYMTTQSGKSIPVDIFTFFVVSTFLYPYSRFVYESIINFFLADNILFANALLTLVSNLIAIVISWSFAIFIAPIGLACLYCHHSKSEA